MEQRSSDVLERGDPAPWFRASALSGNSDYTFSTVAGRHVLLLFFASAARSEARAALDLVLADRPLFDDVQACFFGVTSDPEDASAGRICQDIPGIRYFLDYDRHIGTLYGAAGPAGDRPQWVLLSPSLQVLGRFALADGRAAMAMLRAELSAPLDGWAPVLLVPNVLSSDRCAELIARFRSDGGEESGFTRDVGGRTFNLFDPSHKRRRDWTIDDPALRQSLVEDLRRHLATPIHRAFQFNATRIERYIVSCYTAGAGHFRPHRDNTTKGTAHRRFAVTINLNAGEFDGGDLRFPEFGQRTYRAPTGGAIVFSCSLMHEATPVTRGSRYAFLPFLYDEAAAKLREQNNRFLGKGLAAYRR